MDLVDRSDDLMPNFSSCTSEQVLDINRIFEFHSKVSSLAENTMEQRTKRRAADDGTPSSLTRSISPPSRSKKARVSESSDAEETNPEAGKAHDDDETCSEASDGEEANSKPEKAISGDQGTTSSSRQIFKSPFQLTKIRDLPPESNIDCLTLNDILGDPLISESWEFNYLHNVDFLMDAFDSDVRHLVKVHIVHGFWKKEDANRLALEEAASRYPNVTLHSAFMPEMFGTHHSKMMILVRHDDTVQIVIHTANMIPRDWTNMTQAVWRSPLLTRLTPAQQAANNSRNTNTLQPGSGEKFKVDFLNYLHSYDTRRSTCAPIASHLRQYDFSSIKGSLIASVPGRHDIHDRDNPTHWGWAAMKHALKSVPIRPGKSTIAIQISSIATLGPTDNWLKNTLFNAFTSGKGQTIMSQTPEFKVIFPTPDEIRNSLDGYESGGSIHTKIQSPQQKKQLQYLKPIFYHWGNDSPSPDNHPPKGENTQTHNAGRSRAAPHIKTYIRYGNKSHETTDWALVTSANLSKQAWGEAVSATSGEMRIASYEIGVLVWPGLWDQGQGAVMRGVFRRDMPDDNGGKEGNGNVVGLRMPYSLPLRKYGKDEIPWVATASYDEPDWMGRVWKD